MSHQPGKVLEIREYQTNHSPRYDTCARVADTRRRQVKGQPAALVPAFAQPHPKARNPHRRGPWETTDWRAGVIR